jgi:hypothetical protein
MNNTVKNITIYGLSDITPSDVTEYGKLDKYTDGLFCTADGNVSVVFHDGSTQVFALTAGQTLRVKFKQILAATTATVRGLDLHQ